MMPIEQGFPRPDWAAIGELVEREPPERWHELWTDWARSWVAAVGARLGPSYRVVETNSFIVLTAQSERYATLLGNFMEGARRKMLSTLNGIALDEGYGKHVALIFDEQESYYEYMSYHYPSEGLFALSSGVFLNSAYGHFAFPFLHIAEAEAVSAHELTHACLRHLQIPLWLDEGLAVTMEGEICGSGPGRMEAERFNEHAAFWNPDTIQEFWSGTSFNRTDEGCGLSYELAKHCVANLARDYKVFAGFVAAASCEDGGESAAVAAYGSSLATMIAGFFGDGAWAPEPERWAVHEPPNSALQRTGET